MKYIRTCQECGHTAKYEPPRDRSNPTDAFCDKKCVKCKSEGLDLGTYAPETPEEIAAAKKAAEEWFADE